jgi:signal transduction histidine kinase
MYGNFCEFNDLINIQNDNFIQNMTDFEPKALICSVLTEVMEVCDCKPVFEAIELPKRVVGDKDRLKYILALLVKNSIKRNNQYYDLDLINISAHVSDNQEVDFDLSGFRDRTLVVNITDQGGKIPNEKIKNVKEISTIKEIAKAMGGKLKIDSSGYDLTTFELSLPIQFPH